MSPDDSLRYLSQMRALNDRLRMRRRRGTIADLAEVWTWLRTRSTWLILAVLAIGVGYLAVQAVRSALIMTMGVAL